jgi:hypothetical protein
MEGVGEASQAMSQQQGNRYSFWFAAGISILLSLPYLLALQNFFASDDWVHLYFNGQIPPWHVWRYFSPEVIWFYRPLQALQFGWLYHAAGLYAPIYNLCLLAMHLGVCLMVYQLASHLTTRSTALLTTALFAAQWLCSEMMLWCSNFNTLHWALATLGLCIMFLRYLRDPQPARLVGVYTLFVLNLLTKEAAVNAPLLLGALWWWHTSAERGETTPGARLRAGIRTVGPFALLTALYLGVHHHVVRDVYDGYIRLHYRFASPVDAARQTLFSFNYVLLSFYRDPVVLPLVPVLQSALRFVVEHVLILPFLLAA